MAILRDLWTAESNEDEEVRSRDRKFACDDEVLILLPTNQNKLLCSGKASLK